MFFTQMKEVLLSFIFTIHLALGIVTVSPSCGNISSSCITLAEYSPSSADSIELSLLPGNHMLGSSLRIMNKQSFSLQGPSSGLSIPTITCSQSGYIVQVDHITNVSIGNLVFVQCYVVGTGNNVVSISDTVFHTLPRGGRALQITSSGNVSISGTIFQNFSMYGSLLAFYTINHLEVNYCNFSNITTSSVLHLNQINKVLIVRSGFRGITLNRGGRIIYLGNSIGHISLSTFLNNSIGQQAQIVYADGKHISIFGSTFAGNIERYRSSSIVALRHSDGHSAISCSTFSHNYCRYACALVEVRKAQNSLSNIDATTTISNSTFAQNSLGNHSSAVECGTTCLIISSVFKNNSLRYASYIIDLDDTCAEVKILASQFYQNYFYPYSNLFLRDVDGGRNIVTDCTYFTAFTGRSQSTIMNNTACNQLLEIGERGLCDDCQGIEHKLVA